MCDKLRGTEWQAAARHPEDRRLVTRVGHAHVGWEPSAPAAGSVAFLSYVPWSALAASVAELQVRRQ